MKLQLGPNPDLLVMNWEWEHVVHDNDVVLRKNSS